MSVNIGTDEILQTSYEIMSDPNRVVLDPEDYTETAAGEYAFSDEGNVSRYCFMASLVVPLNSDENSEAYRLVHDKLEACPNTPLAGYCDRFTHALVTRGPEYCAQVVKTIMEERAAA